MDATKLLNSLKVAELKKLCKEEGLEDKGKKAELIERIVAHRKSVVPEEPSHGASSTEPRSLQTVSSSPSVSRADAASSGGNAFSSLSPSPSNVGKPAAKKKRGRPGGKGASSPVTASPNESPRLPSLSCTRCGKKVALRGVYDHSPDTFWCPLCRFKAMDPFNSINAKQGVLKQGFLTATTLKFNLDLMELRQWRRDGFGVEVRMLRFNCSKVAQAWPHELRISVEDNALVTVMPPEDGHKRRDVPQDIASGLKCGKNPIVFSIQDQNLSDFVYAILVTEPQGIHQLTAQVPRCSRKTALARVRDLLAGAGDKPGSSDDIVCLTRDKLKLTCPISMERVQEPVRGERCTHLQCFGLSAYLTSNRQMRAFNNRWQCPVCTLVLRPSDLCFDAYVEQVLAATSPDVEEVIVSSDGSWKCVAPEEVNLDDDESNEAVIDELLLDSQDDAKDESSNQCNNHTSDRGGVTPVDVLDIANVHRHNGTCSCSSSPQECAGGVLGSAGEDTTLFVDSSQPCAVGNSCAHSEAMAVDLDSPISKASSATQEPPGGQSGSSASASASSTKDLARKRKQFAQLLHRPKDSPLKPFSSRSKGVRAVATGGSCNDAAPVEARDVAEVADPSIDAQSSCTDGSVASLKRPAPWATTLTSGKRNNGALDAFVENSATVGPAASASLACAKADMTVGSATTTIDIDIISDSD